jgi:hypothetical protein
MSTFQLTVSVGGVALFCLIVFGLAYRKGVVLPFRSASYGQPFDLTGKNILSLVGSPKDEAKRLFPALIHASAMSVRLARKRTLMAYNGEIADEVHFFRDARQGSGRVTRLMLREGKVIEVTFQF